MPETIEKGVDKYQEPREETGHRVIALYADYDGNAPTTADLFLFSYTWLAKEALEIMKKDAEVSFRGNRYYGWPHAHCDGFEYCKKYCLRETMVPKGTNILKSLEEFLGEADEIG